MLENNLSSKLFADIESNRDGAKCKEQDNKKTHELEESTSKAFAVQNPIPLSESENQAAKETIHAASTLENSQLCNKITNTNTERDTNVISPLEPGRSHENKRDHENCNVETTITNNAMMLDSNEQQKVKKEENVLPSNILATSAKQDVSDCAATQLHQPSSTVASNELALLSHVKTTIIATEIENNEKGSNKKNKAASAITVEEKVESVQEVKSTEELLIKLQHYRAEMIDALDVCLQEIPEEEELEEEYEEEENKEETKSNLTLSPTTLHLEREHEKEEEQILQEKERKKDHQYEHQRLEEEEVNKEQKQELKGVGVCETESRDLELTSNIPVHTTLPLESVNQSEEQKKVEHGVENNHEKETMPENKSDNKQSNESFESTINKNNLDDNSEFTCSQQKMESTDKVGDSYKVHFEEGSSNFTDKQNAAHTQEKHEVTNNTHETFTVGTTETCQKQESIVRVYTIYEWRKLLLLIVNALIQIDRVLYINYGHDMLCTRNELEMLLRAAYKKKSKYRKARRVVSSGNVMVDNNNVKDTTIIDKVTTSPAKLNAKEDKTQHLSIDENRADKNSISRETVSTGKNEKNSNVHDVNELVHEELLCSHEPNESLSSPLASSKEKLKISHYCGDEPMDKFFAVSPPISVAGERFSGTITPLSIDNMAIIHSFSNQVHLYTTNDSDVDLMRSSTTRNSTPMLTEPNETLVGAITPSPVSPHSLSHEMDRANTEDIKNSVSTSKKDIKCEGELSLHESATSITVAESENSSTLANYHELALMQRKKRK